MATSGVSPDEKTILTTIGIPQNYSGRGIAYDSEGQNRDINVGLATPKERQKLDPISPSDPDILPGTADAGAVDGPGDDDVQKGYIWDSITRAGKTFRNYGFHCDLTPYSLPNGQATPVERDPFSKKLRVAFRLLPVGWQYAIQFRIVVVESLFLRNPPPPPFSGLEDAQRVGIAFPARLY